MTVTASTDSIYGDAGFTALIRQRRAIVWRLMAVGMGLFFSIPLVVSQFPHWLKVSLIGPINTGLAFLILQYAIGGAIAWRYAVQMRRIDAMVVALRGEH